VPKVPKVPTIFQKVPTIFQKVPTIFLRKCQNSFSTFHQKKKKEPKIYNDI